MNSSKNIAQEQGQGHQQVKILHKNKNKNKDDSKAKGTNKGEGKVKGMYKGEDKGKGTNKGEGIKGKVITKDEGKDKGVNKGEREGKNVRESPQNIAQGHQQVVKSVPTKARLGQVKIVKHEAKNAQYVQGQLVEGGFVYRAEITTYSQITITARQSGPPIKRRPPPRQHG